MSRPAVSVILPCLDEEESIGMCVTNARQAFAGAGIECEVVVADNGSTDASAAIASEAGGRVISVRRRGYGSAVDAAIETAHADVLLIADADGTYPFDQGPSFVEAARRSNGIVLGSRFAGEIMPGAMPTLHRLVGSPATRLLMRMLFGIRSSDPHSGMRAMTRSVYEKVRPTSSGWEFTVEMLVNASRRSVPVVELPIAYNARIGSSKLRALPEGWGFFRFIVLHSPTFLFVVPGLVVMCLGLAILVWLASVDRDVGPVNLGVNSLVVGALLAIVGYQVVALGACARVYMSSRETRGDGSRAAGRTGLIARWFTLERGILVGGVIFVVGVVMVASVGARWLVLDFGVLPRSDHGLAIAGLTTAVIGMQTIFSSFFISLIRLDQDG